MLVLALEFSITEVENLSQTKIFRTRYHNALYTGIKCGVK